MTSRIDGSNTLKCYMIVKKKAVDDSPELLESEFKASIKDSKNGKVEVGLVYQ